MPANRGRGGGFFRTVLMLAAFAGIAAAQTPAAKPDPLQHLLAAGPPEDPKRIRLHVSLLRVPRPEAAKALLADTGAQPDFWPNQLLKWRDAGLLETVANYGSEAEDGEDGGQAEPQKFRFIGPGAASGFWLDHQESKEAQMPPPDPNELLQELSETDVGDFFRARVTMKRGWQQAGVQFHLLHSHQPEKRPTTTWPLPAFTAPRYLFRPWLLKGFATGRINVPFLLGGQMEPPQADQVHTDHVWMAFGRITLPTRNGREAEEKHSDIQPQHRVQTWTLAVDRKLFLPWVLKRRAFEEDERTLSDWLQRAAAQDGTELLATSAVAAVASRQAELTSTLQWEDATGFEPGGARSEFRARVCESNIYSVQHALAVGLQPASAASVELESDPFAPPPAIVKRPPAAWFVNLTAHRPPAATAWQKFKSAMERDDNDPDAVEIRAAEFGHRSDELEGVMNGVRGDGVQGGMTVAPNQVVMAGACMKEDRVQVTFMRLMQEEPASSATAGRSARPQLPARLEAATLTIWAIDTPGAWQSKLLGEADLDLQAVARELLQAVKDGSVSVAAISSQAQGVDSKGAVAAAEPMVFMGGPYVNTAPAPKGIFFNTRNVGHEFVGDRVELQTNRLENSSDTMLAFSIRSVAKPDWRHWGIWQPGVAGTTADNSGIEQPVFPTLRFESRMRLQPQVPQVMAAVRVSLPGAAAAKSDDSLRWYVVRRDSFILHGDAKLPHEESPRLADYIDHPVVIQAVVVRATRAAVEDAEADAATLLRQAGEGKLPVLDLVTFAKAGNSAATAAGGWDWYFPNGRAHPRNANRSYEEFQRAALNASAVMPAGTRFTDQIYLHNRIVGMELRIEGAEFELTRDALAPEVVTDRFPNVRLEWPGPLPHENWQDVPQVTVNVQRPIFAIEERKGDLPKIGQATVTRLSDDAVLILRVLDGMPRRKAAKDQ